ncbi:ABC transporter permease subunit [Pseudoflavonifractor hominis]|uniref:ABC transporter permease n=1 Tax=Pseudoflavonifractor hominis TaxID=2763059 RepID=A0ABR7HQS3_9FIRM|nr:hypothetical protein [Pseudoflavonifractor hominis]MBC5729885.1 hypothetical protein [Pseudoflavonifractor hominis]
MATPYTLAAMGGLYSDKAGVSSIELEGILLMGAFSGFTAAYMTNQLWIGLAAAMISGVLLAAIYGYMVVYLGSKPALVGTAIVLLATGVTSFFTEVFLVYPWNSRRWTRSRILHFQCSIKSRSLERFSLSKTFWSICPICW